MQVRKEQLQRQQVIMAKLGFYRHVCDGIWGPETISAKKRWEYDGSFIPAIPNNGLPFGNRDACPAGMRLDSVSRLFVLDGLENEEMEALAARGQDKKEKEKRSESESKHDSEPESEPESDSKSKSDKTPPVIESPAISSVSVKKKEE